MFENGFPREWSTIKKLAWLFRSVVNAVVAVLKTVTGNPIHILDALAKPAQALSIALEPIQDLHGYENPWPSGGGKNLCDGIFEQGAGNGSNTARIRQATPFPIKAGVTYTLSASDYTHYYYVINTGQTQNYPWADYTYCGNGEIWTQGSITFTATRDGYLGVIIRKPDNSAIAPSDFTGQVQVEVGSTPTSWTPYSNVCPISGWTEAKVTRTGKNLANMFNDGKAPSVSNGQLVTANGYRSDFIPFKANAAFTFHVTGAAVYMMCYDKDKNFLSAFSNNTGTITNTTPANTAYVMLRKDNNTAPTDAQLEYGTATSYEPYQGTHLTANFSAYGTQYGGWVDVVSGEVWESWISRTYNGSERWNASDSSNPVYFALWNQPNSIGNVDMTQIANWCKAGGAAYQPFGTYRAQANGAVVVGNLDGGVQGAYHFSTVDDFKAYLADNPLQVCYQIATPQLIGTLTPQSLALLEGENNLWSDAGDMTLTYYADGNASDVEALNILLGGRYTNTHGEDEPSDREALNIILGGNER